MDAADADRSAQDALDALLTVPTGLRATDPIPTRSLSRSEPITPWSNPFGDDPLSLAAWISYGEALAGKPMPDHYPHFWKAEKTYASPMEAWYFDLDPDRNPGDHSTVPVFKREELARQLKVASELRPRTRWLRERSRALLAEHAERRYQ